MTRKVPVSFLNHRCKFCLHDKAVSKPSGAFCTRCGKDITEEPIKIKPMRASGTPAKKRSSQKSAKEKKNG